MIYRTLLLTFFTPIAATAESDEPRVFRAGAATSNITLFLGTDLIGGFLPRGSTHIHDDLHARCLVLDDGKTKLAIVIIDNVKFPTEIHFPTKQLNPSPPDHQHTVTRNQISYQFFTILD